MGGEMAISGRFPVGFWRKRFLFAVWAIAAAGQSLGEVTYSIELVPGQVVVPGATITLEVFVESTEDLLVRGIQADLPCVVAPDAGGVGSLSTFAVSGATVRVNDASAAGSGSVPWLFAEQDEFRTGGLRILQAESCRAAGTHGIGEPAYLLPANQRRYVATYRYRVSNCFSGAFTVFFESFNEVPRINDLTRIILDVVGPVSFVPVGVTFNSDTVCPCKEDGDCDDGMTCSGAKSCVDGTCVSRPPPCFSPFCLELEDRCIECIQHNDCDDGNPCTGDTCEPATGRCSNSLLEIGCDDDVPCTANDRCRSGICLGDNACALGWTCDGESLSCVALICPASPIAQAEPPSGIVDARQPHPPADASFSARQGLGDSEEPVLLTLNTDAASGACFQLCETARPSGAGDNAVFGPFHLGNGRYYVNLLRPITSGAVTRVYYLGGNSVTYTFHPGNIDGNLIVDSDDVLTLVEFLETGNSIPPEALHRFDINRSGELDAVDLLREVELLIGSDEYEVQLGTARPENTCP